MDRLKIQQKSRSARNKLAEAVSRGNGTGSLAVPPSTLTINDNASTTGVNEGFPGQSVARDFAIPGQAQVLQPTIEPPTSLQSSVDAGKRIPVPPPKDGIRTPKKLGSVSPDMYKKVQSLTLEKNLIPFDTTTSKKQFSTTSTTNPATWITPTAAQSLQSANTRCSSS